MLFYKAFSIMFAQLGTPSTWCRGQLLFTPFNASGYSNSEIVEKALKWGKLPNGLEVVLLDKSLLRLIDWKGLLHILQFFPRFNLLHLLQVALALKKSRVKNHILVICSVIGLKKLLRMSELRKIRDFRWLKQGTGGLFRIRYSWKELLMVST